MVLRVSIDVPRCLRWSLPALALVAAASIPLLAARAPSSTANASPLSPLGGDGVNQWHRDSCIGSVGEVDEADVDEFVFAGGRVSPKLTVTNGSIVLRYHIQPGYVTAGVDLAETYLFVRYKDNGDDARVRAKLRTFDVTDGASNTLLIFDSNVWPQSDVTQRHEISELAGAIDYDAFQSYYVEVTIDKTSSAGRPELHSVEVWMKE